MTPYVAVIGDIVRSRGLPPRARADVQQDLADLLATFNAGFADAIAASFLITTGDEFQGLLSDATVIADLLWAARLHLDGVTLRYGFGHGPLHTPLKPEAIGMDGPAFHHARTAILAAKKEGWHSGVFEGFGDREDIILNGIARLLGRHLDGMTTRQLRVADLTRDGLDQSQIADRLGVTRQAVSDHLRAMAWPAFAAGERALRAALTFGRPKTGTGI